MSLAREHQAINSTSSSQSQAGDQAINSTSSSQSQAGGCDEKFLPLKTTTIVFQVLSMRTYNRCDGEPTQQMAVDVESG